MIQANAIDKAVGARRKGPNLKTLIVLVAAFLIEGVVIASVFILSGKPADVQADGAAADEAANAERLVEISILDDKFTNTLTGHTYIYETEVYVQVRHKHKKLVEEKLERMKARIRTEIGTIFRGAEPSELHETSLATIKRKIGAIFDELFGRSAKGEKLVQEVLIPKCTQYRADI